MSLRINDNLTNAYIYWDSVFLIQRIVGYLTVTTLSQFTKIIVLSKLQQKWNLILQEPEKTFIETKLPQKNTIYIDILLIYGNIIGVI